MKIHEYQAKELLERYGVRTQSGHLAHTPTQAGEAYTRLGGKLAVIKAQIHAGGRGKGGGVKLVRSRSEAEEVAHGILGMNLVTHQTGPEGIQVQNVFVAEGLDLEEEYYVAIVLDRSIGHPVLMVSREGGVEIEALAEERPEAILMLPFSPTGGLQDHQARRASYFLGFEGELAKQAGRILHGLARVWVELDCELAEINPLVKTSQGELVALDAKMSFDGNALFRQPGIAGMRDPNEEDPREVEASRYGLSYIALNGSIGCMVNGAGLAMATMDNIKNHGASPANFLDVGGGADEETIAHAFRIVLTDPSVQGILVNIFGGIMKCDIIARGILAAAEKVELRVPLVVRLEGTRVEEGRAILAESGLDITPASSLDEGARLVCEAVGDKA